MRWYCTRDLFGSQIPVTAGGFEPQKIGHILKNKQKFKCVYIHEIRRLIIMKMKMKMKYRSHRYDIIDLGLHMNTNLVNVKSVAL